MAVESGMDLVDGALPYRLAESGCALLWSRRDLNRSLDLNDQQFKRDYEPISKQCPCLACTKHTRAYIHHLLETHEILASILLMK